MTNTLVNRTGQINQAGSDLALFLKQFGGEILTEFHNNTVYGDKNFTRSISNGREAQFPLIGGIGSGYHAPGQWIDAMQTNFAEKTIAIDGLLYSSTFFDQLDDLMLHYDVRGPVSAEMGKKLAEDYDMNIARTITQAARTATSPLTGRAGGSIIVNANMKTSSAALSAALWAAAEALDVKKVSSDGRYCMLRPAQYYLMAQDTNILNKDWGGTGGIASGRFESLAGIPVYKTNHVPSVNETAATSVFSKYRGDYSNLAGLVFNNMAAGTLKLLDLSMETEWEVRRQGWFTIAKMAVGHGTLREDCAISLQTS